MRVLGLLRTPGCDADGPVAELLELEGREGAWSVTHIVTRPDPCPGAVLGWCIAGLDEGLTDEIARRQQPYREFRIVRDVPERQLCQHDVLRVTVDRVQIRRRGAPSAPDPLARIRTLQLAGVLDVIEETP